VRRIPRFWVVVTAVMANRRLAGNSHLQAVAL